MNHLRKLILNGHRFMFARSALRPINTLLFYLSVRGLGLLNYENAAVSGELNFINKILPKLVHRQNPVFFDVGANAGKYTDLLNQRFPKALIHAVEPHPKSFSILNGRHLLNVKYHNMGFGEKNGTAILYDRPDEDGLGHASLHPEVITALHQQSSRSMEIRMGTLDDFARAQNIDYIDFIKIDCEGNELSVLKGAGLLIAKDAIGCLQFEFNEMNVVSRCFLRDFRALLPGYSFFRILPHGLLDLDQFPAVLTELFAFQNILAVPKKNSDV